MQLEQFKQKYKYSEATPVMKQYLDVKFAHLECLLLFRMGDFYELFYEDALTASRVLSIALTRRGKSGEDEIPMCGVPHHALENYLNKLLADGFKVAICDQLETPEQAKKRGGYKAVVQRNVTRIITPGTIFEDSLLEDQKPNYLCAISIIKDVAAICWLDISTSEIAATRLPVIDVTNEIARLQPNEILLSDKYRQSDIASFISNSLDKLISFQVDSFFAKSKCETIIKNFYQINSVEAISDLDPSMISAIGAILEYISITQKDNIPDLQLPRIVNFNKHMSIDSSTRQNLELVSSNNGNKSTLFYTINKTVSKPGSRLLYRFLSAPLINIDEINHRLNITAFFREDISLCEVVRESLKNTSDLERCTSRLNMNRCSPRDLLSIMQTIEIAEKIYAQINNNGASIPEEVTSLTESLIGNAEIYSLINESIREDAPNILSDGNYIKHEYHAKIKELHQLINNASSHVEHLRDKYRQQTGIDTLKINHNNVLGLFIDVTIRHADKMSNENFIHRQSTANSARYTTAELQELESKIVNAKQLVIALEKEVFDKITDTIKDKSSLLYAMAESLALIDVFCSFAYMAFRNNYCRPILTENIEFNVKSARHPVVENSLAKETNSFIANNCNLNFDERIWLITGPNMAGKSTFLRQNALIAILSQTGSFVPAESATIGITDKIFSRIGAGDDLSRGQSTFMVEMIETASILSQSTKNSLIILDEVGRGTSTYDGVAIAWSVLEHIHDKIRARCLFATHYHELTKMDQILLALKNYTIAIDENDEKITFLHKIIKGAANKSYGVHVATIAGLPASVIKRSYQLLKKFEKDSTKSNKEILKGESINMSLFDSALSDQAKISDEELAKHQEIRSKLDNINPDQLTPMDALNIVYELKTK